MFDYVIVGAGSAGCVLAHRLSADDRVRVALVEAGGPDDRREFHIPAAFSKLFRTSFDWDYFTEEQAHLNGRRLYWPRGKVLGGSSSINAMIWTRGHRRDFETWPGWTWAEVAPFFDRTLIDVSPLRTTNPLSRAFVTACEESGIRPNERFHEESEEGAGFFHVTQRRGRRCSSAVAYLKPALRRKNLSVFTRALTTRVLFEGTRAVGVECVQNGQVTQVRAAREVLLCGGAVNSPQLLMLSGIGAASDLRAHGIAVVAHVPEVGTNLQDHLTGGASYACTRPVSLAGAETLGNVLRYIVFRKGMLASNVAEAGGFVRLSADAAAPPDLELIFGPVFYMNHGFANPPGHGFTLGAIVLHPRSRGTIRLRSADPTVAPAIDPRYCSEGVDFELLREGMRLCRRIAGARAFDRFRGEEVWPGARWSDEDAFLRDTCETLYHPVGTCSIGTVVDVQLRVRGVEGLRVVDASVMPSILTGHPNAAVVMIAERAAAMIDGG